MKPDVIQNALTQTKAEQDPSVKAQKIASLCSALFRERGIELVIVGGSAIEFYTEGRYASADVDLWVLNPPQPIPLRLRQEIMGKLGAEGGPRSWEVAGLFVDLLGVVEKEARTPIRQVQGPFGMVNLIDPEELFVERVLVSVYPSANLAARSCARQLASVGLSGALEMDWKEVRRLAEANEYKVFDEVQRLVGEMSDELKVSSPYDSQG